MHSCTVTRAQRADAQQSAPAQQSSKAAERSPEEKAARQRFEAQAGQDSGDQGLRKALLNSALALLEEAAATRKVMVCKPTASFTFSRSSTRSLQAQRGRRSG